MTLVAEIADDVIDKKRGRVIKAHHAVFFSVRCSRMRMPARLSTLLLAGVMATCAGSFDIAAAQSTLAEARASLGRPTDVRFDANGEELWEYARGPSGTETYLIRAGKDGRVKSITQLLTEERFAKIVPGRTTKRDARHLLGRPTDQDFLHNGTSWSWHVHLNPQIGHFVVHFDPNDVVLNKFVLIDAGSGESEGDRGDAD